MESIDGVHFQHLCHRRPPFGPKWQPRGARMTPTNMPNGKTMNEWSIANTHEKVVDTPERGSRPPLAGRSLFSPAVPPFTPLGPPKWGHQLPKTSHPKNWSDLNTAPQSSWKWFFKVAWGGKSRNPRCYSCFHAKRGPFQTGPKVTFLTLFLQFHLKDRSIYMSHYYNFQMTGYKHLGTILTWNISSILEKL